MDEYSQIINIVALSMGLGWASGVNLYAALLTLGVLSLTGSMELPPGLDILENPAVIGAAALLACRGSLQRNWFSRLNLLNRSI